MRRTRARQASALLPRPRGAPRCALPGRQLALALWLAAGCAVEEGALAPVWTEPAEADPALGRGGRVLGPAGGRVSVGPVTVEIPEGALADRVRITIDPARPGGPLNPLDETSPTLPEEPGVRAAVLVGPVGLVLLKPGRVLMATSADVSGLALTRAAPLSNRLAWQPLPGQQRSPGLLWGGTSSLGAFSLIEVRCCPGAAPPPGRCQLRCDAGPLSYSCEGTGPARRCCDPFVDLPAMDLPGRCP